MYVCVCVCVCVCIGVQSDERVEEPSYLGREGTQHGVTCLSPESDNRVCVCLPGSQESMNPPKDGWSRWRGLHCSF